MYAGTQMTMPSHNAAKCRQRQLRWASVVGARSSFHRSLSGVLMRRSLGALRGYEQRGERRSPFSPISPAKAGTQRHAEGLK